MPIRHAVWKVGPKPTRLDESSLVSEAAFEDMIVADPSILSDRWLIIGRQVQTDYRGKVDLLALNQDGQLIVIELKRDLTPREVVAQALDYASWAQQIKSEQLARIFNNYSNGKSLNDAFKEKFNLALDEEQLNGSHQIVVVASSLDPSSERIVNYLNSRNVPINVIFFQVFKDGATQYLSRAWLIDPAETETRASSGQASTTADWNGEVYVSFGHDDYRNWEEARKYGFISGGGGAWYSRTLFQLEPGERVWVNVPGTGYVGVGRVTGTAVRAKDFKIEVDGKMVPWLKVTKTNYGVDSADDEEMSEYFVPVKWIDTRSLDDAISEVGFFGNQNTVCCPVSSKWEHTIERLKKQFSLANDSPNP